MKIISTSAAVFCLGMTAAFGALDLTPYEIILQNDGPPMKRYYFQDGAKRLSFRIDAKMAVNGGGNSVGFRFEDLRGSAMKVSRSQLNPEIPFDEKNLITYRNTARAMVAADAANVQLDEETPQAIAINGWTSHQFNFSFTLLGIPCRKSITFLNYSEKEQFIFEVSATSAEFEKTYARGYRVLNSLSDLPINTAGPS